MTRHRTITGFAAIAMLAAAATAANMRSHALATDGSIASIGATMLKGFTGQANKLAAASFDDRWSAISASATDTVER